MILEPYIVSCIKQYIDGFKVQRQKAHLGKSPQTGNVQCLQHFLVFWLPASMHPFPSHSLPLHPQVPKVCVGRVGGGGVSSPLDAWCCGLSTVSFPLQGEPGIDLGLKHSVPGRGQLRLEDHFCSVAGAAVQGSTPWADRQHDCGPGCQVPSGSCLFSESDPQPPAICIDFH